MSLVSWDSQLAICDDELLDAPRSSRTRIGLVLIGKRPVGLARFVSFQQHMRFFQTQHGQFDPPLEQRQQPDADFQRVQVRHFLLCSPLRVGQAQSFGTQGGHKAQMNTQVTLDGELTARRGGDATLDGVLEPVPVEHPPQHRERNEHRRDDDLPARNTHRALCRERLRAHSAGMACLWKVMA